MAGGPAPIDGMRRCPPGEERRLRSGWSAAVAMPRSEHPRPAAIGSGPSCPHDLVAVRVQGYSPFAIWMFRSAAQRRGLSSSGRSEPSGVMRHFMSFKRSRSRTSRSSPDSHGIVVVDDLFPDLTTGFRVAEFSWLLRAGVVREVMTSLPQLEDHLPSFLELYPD